MPMQYIDMSNPETLSFRTQGLMNGSGPGISPKASYTPSLCGGSFPQTALSVSRLSYSSMPSNSVAGYDIVKHGLAVGPMRY